MYIETIEVDAANVTWDDLIVSLPSASMCLYLDDYRVAALDVVGQRVHIEFDTGNTKTFLIDREVPYTASCDVWVSDSTDTEAEPSVDNSEANMGNLFERAS